jgi:carbamoyl-phosphate synthase large subunit
MGSTFQESLQKALRGLETDKVGLDPMVDLGADDAKKSLDGRLRD